MFLFPSTDVFLLCDLISDCVIWCFNSLTLLLENKTFSYNSHPPHMQMNCFRWLLKISSFPPRIGSWSPRERRELRLQSHKMIIKLVYMSRDQCAVGLWLTCSLTKLKKKDMGSIMRSDGEKDTLSIFKQMSFQCDSNCFQKQNLVFCGVNFWLRVLCRAVLLTKPKCLYLRPSGEILCEWVRWVSSYFWQTETRVVGFTEWHPWSCWLKFSHNTLEGFFWSATWYINILK